MRSQKCTKGELKEILLTKVNDWIEHGDTPEEAIGKLTEKQYDFLIDQGVDFDSLLMTPEEIKSANKVKRSPRSLSPNGYNKKYPQEKQDLYNGIVDYIKAQGAEIIPREKCNYRDLDFVIQGTVYRIVLSNPKK